MTCPSCNNRFTSPVLTIIDLAQNPEAKALLLAGQLNIAVCPQCGSAGMLSTPLIYHDPDKELLLTYMPSELGMPDAEQQRIIGDLTNRVMSALPAEQRKGYLLRPQSFLRLEALLEAILGADGITPEMLKAQQTKTELLDQLMRATSEDARRTLVQTSGDLLDYEFFRILTVNIELAEASGKNDAAQELLGLRKQLLEWTAVGQEVAAREEVLREFSSEISQGELLEKLIQAASAGENAKVEAMVAVARPAIDYLFYQQLTGRIEAAELAGDTAEADTLKALRESVLDLTAKIDAEVQRASEQAAQLLYEIVESDDMERSLRANLDRIDDLFINTLAVNLQHAEQAGRQEDVDKLTQLGDILMKLIQESQPPEIAFINQLLSAEYPAGTLALLEENRQQVSVRLIETMRVVEKDLIQSGREQVAQHLAEIREQAATMVA
ncbi:MAG: CpXC domain-containing protein [Anaerolineae bacterium]